MGGGEREREREGGNERTKNKMYRNDNTKLVTPYTSFSCFMFDAFCFCCCIVSLSILHR